MIKILVTLLLCYICILLLIFMFQRKLLYFPYGEYHPPQMVGAMGAEELFVSATDGTQLVSWYWPAQEGKKTIIFFHGNAAPIATNMPLFGILLSKGFGVLAVEYRGYPGAQGKPSEQGLYADARANISYLLSEKNLTADDIILLGQSLGTGVAVQIATEYPAHALILLSPFDSVRAVAHNKYWYFFAWYLLKDRYESSSKIHQVNADIVIFHGSDDRIVPIAHGKKLFDAIVSERKAFITQEGIGHNNLDLVAIAEHLDARYNQ